MCFRYLRHRKGKRQYNVVNISGEEDLKTACAKVSEPVFREADESG